MVVVSLQARMVGEVYLQDMDTAIHHLLCSPRLSCGQTFYGILTVSRKYHSRDRMFSGLYVVIAGKIQVLPISLRLR